MGQKMGFARVTVYMKDQAFCLVVISAWRSSHMLTSIYYLFEFLL